MTAATFRSGKGHRDENFPVASLLIDAQYRAPILAFYDFVRIADDIADHPRLAAHEKLEHLDELEAGLLGHTAGEPAAQKLRAVLAQHGLSPGHAQDLLTAFRMDVTKLRYETWDELIGYCRYSAMPVGRFVLDVHQEPRSTWPANDALCAALQINNHIQDCGADYRNLDRVYIPLDAFATAGAKVEELGAPRASPSLLACLHGLARHNEGLLNEGRDFAGMIRNLRLSLEVAVITVLAQRIVGLIASRDPLSENVHLTRTGVIGGTIAGIATAAFSRLKRRSLALHRSKDA
jgi:hydroxysqualene synthase